MLLLLEPLMYLIIAIAEEYEIDPVIYEGMDNDIAGEEDVNKAISAKKVKEIRKDMMQMVHDMNGMKPPSQHSGH